VFVGATLAVARPLACSFSVSFLQEQERYPAGGILVERQNKMQGLNHSGVKEHIMKNARGYYILAIAWILVSLFWFFWEKNIAMGAIWLGVGLIELVIAILHDKKSKR
jgi:hypothetical protein